ncbi:MAG: ABC transporter permease [Proteobacteria bacterium]|nr:ABC transporter permease [Pseudomonadota bacterium]
MVSNQHGEDERLRTIGLVRSLLSRPALGAAGGAIVIWTIFAIVASDRGFVSLQGTATYLEVAAELGILAIAVALLMIGGEFDLSIGSMIGLTGMAMTILSVNLGLSIPIAMVLSLAIALGLGFLNGYMVVRTGLPSFIVTLGSLFILRGLTIGTTRLLTGRTQLGGLDEASGYGVMSAIFASDISISGVEFPISILWWVAITAFGTFVLLKSRVGNWIFSIGGDVNSARMMGVPVRRVKIALFMTTAAAAWLVAMIQAISFTGADVLRGEQREFYAIIAAVIGGTLLTGGYGSLIGAALGALIFGMVRQGIVFAGVDADWFQVALGSMLVMAVLVNSVIRRKAAETKR